MVERRARMSFAAFGCSVLVAALLTACPRTQSVRVGAILREADQNEIATFQKYRSERLIVAGMVVATGSHRSDRAELSQPAFWYMSPSISTSSEQYPWVHIVESDAGGTRGQALCYFDPGEVDKPARLNRGAQVTLAGNFSQSSNGPQGRGIVLDGCEIK